MKLERFSECWITPDSLQTVHDAKTLDELITRSCVFEIQPHGYICSDVYKLGKVDGSAVTRYVGSTFEYPESVFATKDEAIQSIRDRLIALCVKFETLVNVQTGSSPPPQPCTAPSAPPGDAACTG